MKAIVHDTYGSTDVLELRDMDKPEIAADEVLVQVRAAGVARGDWHVMTGLPYPIRLAGYGVRTPKNPVLGMELAGVVAATGTDVTRFAVGDEVFGIGKEAYAEYARVLESKLAPKPANLTFEQSAVTPVSGLTALQALRDKGRVQPGQHVLVIGASGGGRDLRRPAGEGVRREGHRSVQHHEGRPGPRPGSRSGHRLHPRGLRQRRAAL